MTASCVRIPSLLLLAASMSIACTSTPQPAGPQESSPPVEVPEPTPTPEPDPTPDPDPQSDPGEGSEGKACGARAGSTCAADEYCAYEPSGMCGWADATAVCKTKPEMCTQDHDPVCGCDQKVYSNACAAAAAGTGVLKKGDCKDLPGQG